MDSHYVHIKVRTFWDDRLSHRWSVYPDKSWILHWSDLNVHDNYILTVVLNFYILVLLFSFSMQKTKKYYLWTTLLL